MRPQDIPKPVRKEREDIPAPAEPPEPVEPEPQELKESPPEAAAKPPALSREEKHFRV